MDSAEPSTDAVPYDAAIDPEPMLEAGVLDGVMCACDADDVAQVLTSAPELTHVVAAAQRAAGLGEDPVPSWRTRSRWSALVPAISARVGNSESWREVTDPTVSRATSYDVRASWRLDRLVFDANAPRLAAFDLQRRRERRRIAALTTRAYFVWLEARATLVGARSHADRAGSGGHALMAAQRAHGELDALTDGWFSRAVAEAATRSGRGRL